MISEMMTSPGPAIPLSLWQEEWLLFLSQDKLVTDSRTEIKDNRKTTKRTSFMQRDRLKKKVNFGPLYFK